jgi:hypothetical protein
MAAADRHARSKGLAGAMFAVHGPVPSPEDELLAGVHLGRARTLYQDPSFGLRQLVDVAIQALSPALNQPTTAGQVVDRLEDILLRVAHRPEPTGLFTDGPGVVRLVQRVPTFAGLLELAFTEITADGASSPQVARRLLAAYDDLGPARARTAPPFDRAAASGHPGQYPEGRRRRYPVLGPAAGSHRTWLTNHTEGRSGGLQLDKGAATTRDRTG